MRTPHTSVIPAKLQDLKPSPSFTKSSIGSVQYLFSFSFFSLDVLKCSEKVHSPISFLFICLGALYSAHRIFFLFCRRWMSAGCCIASADWSPCSKVTSILINEGVCDSHQCFFFLSLSCPIFCKPTLWRWFVIVFSPVLSLETHSSSVFFRWRTSPLKAISLATRNRKAAACRVRSRSAGISVPIQAIL